MVWLNWRGAISRGALLALLCWSGMAWTQAPDPRPASEVRERIMVVHENGKAVRCRVLESWRLPDGRIAHLLQALDTGAMITIVDDQAPTSDQAALLQKNPRAMPKRIFPWRDRQTPPDGSPVPPHLRMDSGLVLKNESPPPSDAMLEKGPTLMNRVVDEKAVGKAFGVHSEGTQQIDFPANLTMPSTMPANPVQLVEVPPAPPVIGQGSPQVAIPTPLPATPVIVNQTPATLPASAKATNMEPEPLVINGGNLLPRKVGEMPPITLPDTPGIQNVSQAPQPITTASAPTTSTPQPGPLSIPGGVNQTSLPAPSTITSLPTPAQAATPVPYSPVTSATPIVQGPDYAAQPNASPELMTPQQNKPALIPYLRNWFGSKNNGTQEPAIETTVPTNVPRESSLPAANTLPQSTPANIAGATQTFEPERKSWRFGDRIQSLFQPKSALARADEPQRIESRNPDPQKLELPKAEPQRTEFPKAEPKKNDAIESLLPAQNKVEEKKLEQKLEKVYKAPFSTAMGTNPKTEPTPLVIPNQPPQTPELPEKTGTPALPDPPAVPKQSASIAEPAAVPQREMWGTAHDDKVAPPGKTLLDSATRLQERKNDPLMAPERLISNADRSKLPPELARPVEVRSSPRPTELPRSLPSPDEGKWPPGAQSVLAAKSGMPGPVIYVPVPTVTVPQPNNAPLPPEPKLPEGPQLNAFVNAFSPPPAPNQNRMSPNMAQQPMAYGPAMNAGPTAAQQQWYQQQMMAQAYQQQAMQQQTMQQQTMQQQTMQQQAMQQQAMQQQAMSPYANHQVQGMANPYGGSFAQPAAYSPVAAQTPAMNFTRSYAGPGAPNPFAGNPAAQSGIAPATYQQSVMSPQYAIAVQVEQTIRVLRESPYPAQREWAAQTLVSFDWRTNPQLVPVLLQAATQDPAPAVRAGCVYCLGRMQAAVEPVFSTLQMLRNDADPRVRQEVEQAFVRLGQPGPSARSGW